MSLDINAVALGDWVPIFVRANNRLAGIDREPTEAEVGAHRGLFAANTLRVGNLEMFVHHVAGGAQVREAGRDASEGEEGCSAAELRADLATIVMAAQSGAVSPIRLHRIITLLRPFTDGNDRCGRALLMWQMLREMRPKRGSLRPGKWSAGPRSRTSLKSALM